MIETTIRDFLKAELDVPVYMEILEKPAKSFVTIQKMDAGKKDHIKAATISIEAVAETKYKTALLSEQVVEKMEELGESDYVFSTELGGESDNTDTANKKYRYETIWNIFY